MSIEVSIRASVVVYQSTNPCHDAFSQVQCVPHTKLQLLNLRPEYMSLVSSSIRRQFGKWSLDVPSIEDLRSPISGPTPHDKNKQKPVLFTSPESLERSGQQPLTTIPEESSTEKSGSSRNAPSSSQSVASREYSVYSTEPATDVLSIPDTGSFSQSGSSRAVSEGKSSNSGLMELPESIGPGDTKESEHVVEDIRQGEFSIVSEDEEISVPQNLGKRSASDAFLSDSEENEKSMLRICLPSDESRNVSSESSSVESNELNLQSTHGNVSNGHRKRNLNTKPSLIPRRARLESSLESLSDDPGPWHGIPDSKAKVIDQSDGGNDSQDDPVSDMTPGAEETLDFDEDFNPQTKIASDELLNSDTDEESLDAECDLGPQETSLQSTLTHEQESTGTDAGADPSILSIEPESMQNGGNPKLTTPVRPQNATSDSQIVFSVTELEDEDPFETPRANENLYTEETVIADYGDPDSPTPMKLPKFVNTASDKRHVPTGSVDRSFRQMHEPKLDLVDGILVVSNPFRADSATYKITMTTEVELQKGRIGNWSHLKVPGLPRMKSDENGWFLFQIPDSVGIEFRTTSFGSHKFVEDCFLAELVQSGDLNIPLRLCPRSFYGTLGDFTVDQEIQSEHVTHKHSQERMVVYSAVCSLRLYKRCFFSERCCFYLWIDGGPEGDYRCEMDSTGDTPAFLRLPSGDRSIGVSCIQIDCSPRDLGAFCLSWSAECRCDEGSEWLPRIFSGPTSTTRRKSHDLRKVMSRLSNIFVRKTILDPLGVKKGNVRLDQHAAVPAQTKGYYSLRRMFTSIVMTLVAIFLGLAVLIHVHPGSVDLVRDTAFSNLALVESSILRVFGDSVFFHARRDAYTVFKETNIASITETEHTDDDRSEATPDPQLSWRDRLDYLLGWQGPTG